MDARTRFIPVPPLFGGLDASRLGRWHGRQCVYLSRIDDTVWALGVIGVDVPVDAMVVLLLSNEGR